MAENTTTPAATEKPADSDADVKAPGRWTVFKTNHPRAARAAKITTIAVAAATGGWVAKTVHGNKDHVIAAGEHLQDAAGELSASVSLTDSEA